MRVVEAERGVQEFSYARLAGVLRVDHVRDGGDAVNERALRGRQYADGDVELVGKGRDLAGPAVRTEIFEDLHGVAALAGRRGKRILDGLGQPKAAGGVEGDVD